jgi:hypothetical protein
VRRDFRNRDDPVAILVTMMKSVDQGGGEDAVTQIREFKRILALGGRSDFIRLAG